MPDWIWQAVGQLIRLRQRGEYLHEFALGSRPNLVREGRRPSFWCIRLCQLLQVSFGIGCGSSLAH